MLVIQLAYNLYNLELVFSLFVNQYYVTTILLLDD